MRVMKMRRRIRSRTYNRIGRPAIGFYNDSKGRTRPITPGRGKKFRVILPRRIQAREPPLNIVVSYVLSQAPIAKELYTGYILADALYKNWNLIAQLYDTYERKRWRGVTDIIGSSVAQNASSSVQTNIAWAAVNPFIPKEYHSVGKQILANVMDKVTTEEIKLVKQFLQTR